MYSTSDLKAIATTSSNCKRQPLRIPAKKAKYSDKARVKLADIKRIALRECECKDTSEMKRRLRVLNIKADLRYTATWIAIAWELQPLIASLSEQDPADRSCHELPALPTKKSLHNSSKQPPQFSCDEEAMNYYLAKSAASAP